MSQIHNAISVVIPTYNRAHLIKESLQSVLDQTLQPYEIIVVDDFSTDNTEEVVRSLNSPLIKYVKNQRKKGANGARNTGILMALCEFIAFQDSDDIWLRNKLNRQYFFLKDKNISFCFCSMVSFNNVTNELEKVIPKRKVDYNKINKILYNKNIISTQTIFMLTELAKKNLFDENLNRYQDWDFVLRLLENGVNLIHLNEILVNQYINNSSISSSNTSIDSFCAILSKHPNLSRIGMMPKAIMYKSKFIKKKSIINLIYYVYGVLVLRLNFYRYWY